MNPTVIYHWWAEEAEQPAYSNLAHPILLSIATLRAVNPTIKIEVLNCSKYRASWDQSKNPWESSDWIHFQKKFDFKVWGSSIYLEKRYGDIAGSSLLSRLFDIHRHQSQYPIIYCDSDVFWFRDPLPLSGDMNKFCFDGYNSGFFYYDPNSDIIDEFFEIFESYSITCLKDKTFCDLVKNKINFDFNSWNYIWDEKILHYIRWQDDHMFCVIPQEEHGLIRFLNSNSSPKMLHCNGLTITNPIAKRKHEKLHCRGLACLLFAEFYNNLRKVLSDTEIAMIFTKSELDHYLPQQFSLIENIDRVKATAIDEWNYDLQKTLIKLKLEIP